MSPRRRQDQTRCSRRFLPTASHAQRVSETTCRRYLRVQPYLPYTAGERCSTPLGCIRGRQTTFPQKPAEGARQVSHIIEKDHLEQAVLLLTSDEPITLRLGPCHPPSWGICSLYGTTVHRASKHIHQSTDQ